uniref:Uncharacterized protein n=1 Tax=Aegilops tauschii subsp. strangulata TaxID=200361 RepID=A0A452XXK9_AEGTS
MAPHRPDPPPAPLLHHHRRPVRGRSRRGQHRLSRRVWSQLRDFFPANQPAQAVHLSAEFRALTQGDLRVAEYCGRLKALADALADVDEPVTDRTLTLQLLRGLSRRYQELTQDARDRSDGSSALSIGLGGGGSSSSGDRGSSSTDCGKAPMERGGSGSSGGHPDRGRGRGRVRGRGRGHPGGRGHATPPAGAGQTPWLGYFAPWGAPFPPPARAPWVPPNAAGVLGPRPTAPQQAYPLMYAGPSAPPSHPPSWDPAALYSALNQMTLQQPGATDWYLDTGASAHVTGNAGPGNADPPNEAQ